MICLRTARVELAIPHHAQKLVHLLLLNLLERRQTSHIP